MFLQVSVILFTGGRCLVPGGGCLVLGRVPGAKGVWSWGVSGPGGRCLVLGGCLVPGGSGPRGVPGPRGGVWCRGGCLVLGRVPGARGVWSWGVSGPGGRCLVLGGCLVPGGSGPRGVPGPRGGVWSQGVPGEDPPDGYCCGRYAFYWNAFLLTYFLQGSGEQEIAPLPLAPSAAEGTEVTVTLTNEFMLSKFSKLSLHVVIRNP